jgi:Lrp/AsnC family leucine-responsive transcriptional regulator
MVLKSNYLQQLNPPRFTGNEKRVLKILLKNARVSDVSLGETLRISPQAIAKIRKKLESLGVIKKYVVEVDYSKIGVNVLALTMIEINNLDREEIKKVLDSFHGRIINLSKLLMDNESYIALFGFSKMEEIHDFFYEVQKRFPKIFRLRNLYLFHVGGFHKNSSKDLFYKLLSDSGMGPTTLPKKAGYYSYSKDPGVLKRLSENEKNVLRYLIKNGRLFYNRLSQSIATRKLSGRGICKIKERLERKGVIKGYTIDLDYSILGINVFAFVFIKKKVAGIGLKQGLERWAELSENVIESYGLEDGSLQAFFCGFRSLEELESYWANFEQLNGEFFEIKKIYISSASGGLRPSTYFLDGGPQV